jgi:hypothetical protein
VHHDLVEHADRLDRDDDESRLPGLDARVEVTVLRAPNAPTEKSEAHAAHAAHGAVGDCAELEHVRARLNGSTPRAFLTAGLSRGKWYTPGPVTRLLRLRSSGWPLISATSSFEISRMIGPGPRANVGAAAFGAAGSSCEIRSASASRTAALWHVRATWSVISLKLAVGESDFTHGAKQRDVESLRFEVVKPESPHYDAPHLRIERLVPWSKLHGSGKTLPLWQLNYLIEMRRADV